MFFPPKQALKGSPSFRNLSTAPSSSRQLSFLTFVYSLYECRWVGVGVLTWFSEVCMGLSTGEPAGLQSSGKGFGMAGREAGRSCCSSCRHLQRETHTLMSKPSLINGRLTLLFTYSVILGIIWVFRPRSTYFVKVKSFTLNSKVL